MLINNPSSNSAIKNRDVSNILQFQTKKSIKDINLQNKRVLVRVDYNVPLDEKGAITDSTRIENTLPTLEYLLEKNCKIILISHLGRPKGKVVKAFSLYPVYLKLKEILPNTKIIMAEDCIGPQVQEQVNELNNGEILLLENPRFHIEEENNDPEFARALSQFADAYITDAFATAHRKQASTYGVCSYFEDKGYGFLIEKELKFLSNCITNPKRPFTVILGGKKVEDKLGVIEYLLGLADNLLIGGGMVYTFLLAKGYTIGKSIKDLAKINEIKKYLELSDHGTKIFLPKDVIVSDNIDSPSEISVVSISEIKENQIGCDIGPETIKSYQNILKQSKQVIWNGPMGIFEKREYEKGTKEIAKYLVDNQIFTVAGGGETAAAFEKYGLQDKVSFISTGGGASLEIMKGSSLPAIECLSDK